MSVQRSTSTVTHEKIIYSYLCEAVDTIVVNLAAMLIGKNGVRIKI